MESGRATLREAVAGTEARLRGEALASWARSRCRKLTLKQANALAFAGTFGAAQPVGRSTALPCGRGARSSWTPSSSPHHPTKLALALPRGTGASRLRLRGARLNNAVVRRSGRTALAKDS